MVGTLVWITGASSGLGAALATAVPYRDAVVVDISRSGSSAGTEHVPADLADPTAWSAVELHLRARMGAFSGDRVIFIHNAGTLEPIGFAGEVDAAAYRTNVLLNSAAGQVLGHAFLGAVADSGFSGTGSLVMISSGAAGTPYPGWSSYCAGKAALDHWVRTVGLEQRERGSPITVLAIAPGVVATPMQEHIRSVDEARFPNVGRFRDLYADGALRDPAAVAADLWRLIASDPPSGSVLDLRSA